MSPTTRKISQNFVPFIPIVPIPGGGGHDDGRPWKRAERQAAALFGGRRFPANTGDAVDFETATVVGQVKHVRHLSLAGLEALAVEAERIGALRTLPKAGVVIVKRRAGRGRSTTRIVVMTDAAWRRLHRDPFGTAPQDIGAP